jgi:hypothetical protein
MPKRRDRSRRLGINSPGTPLTAFVESVRLEKWRIFSRIVLEPGVTLWDITQALAGPFRLTQSAHDARLAAFLLNTPPARMMRPGQSGRQAANR